MGIRQANNPDDGYEVDPESPKDALYQAVLELCGEYGFVPNEALGMIEALVDAIVYDTGEDA